MSQTEPRNTPAAPSVDPVCGMTVTGEDAPAFTWEGETFVFCCSGCRDRFREDPGRYQSRVNEESATSGSCCGSADATQNAPVDVQVSAALATAQHTCPMHPEVERLGPGDCPLCGMPLEPLDVSLEPSTEGGAASAESRAAMREFLIALTFTLPLFVLTMSGVLTRTFQLLLASPVVLYAGASIYRRAFVALRRRVTNMYTLIGASVLVAYGASVWSVVLASMTDGARSLPLYFESAAMIVTLVHLGGLLEVRARRETGSALRSLTKLKPTLARRITEEGEQDVPVSDVRVGDALKVLPGALVPVDGVVTEGRSEVDEEPPHRRVAAT